MAPLTSLKGHFCHSLRELEWHGDSQAMGQDSVTPGDYLVTSDRCLLLETWAK